MIKIVEPPASFEAVTNQAEKHYRDEVQQYDMATLVSWLKDKLAYYDALQRDGVVDQINGATVELGAGHCWLTALLSQRAAVTSIAAVDLSAKQLKEVAPQVIRYLHGDETKITLVINDFNNLDFPAGSLDTIIFDAALHHATDPVTTLRKLTPLLTPSGQIICIREPIIPPLYYFNKAAVYKAHGVEEKKYGVTENIFTLTEWRAIFTKANLTFQPLKLSYNMIRQPLLKQLFSSRLWNGLLYSEMVFVSRPRSQV
jgi:ubiquinone/menaquinone biosynthesis C-methylase UbiE